MVRFNRYYGLPAVLSHKLNNFKTLIMRDNVRFPLLFLFLIPSYVLTTRVL